MRQQPPDVREVELRGFRCLAVRTAATDSWYCTVQGSRYPLAFTVDKESDILHGLDIVLVEYLARCRRERVYPFPDQEPAEPEVPPDQLRWYRIGRVSLFIGAGVAAVVLVEFLVMMTGVYISAPTMGFLFVLQAVVMLWLMKKWR